MFLLLTDIQFFVAMYKKSKAVRNAAKQRLRQKGLCLNCGLRAMRAGLTTCQECADFFIKRYEDCKAQRICVSCRKRPAKDNILRCHECTIRHRLRRLDVLPSEKEKARQSLKEFDGKCQCCGNSDPGGYEWCLDHCHETKMFRGIVCYFCNWILGHAHDQVKVLLSAVSYLQRTGGRPH